MGWRTAKLKYTCVHHPIHFSNNLETKAIKADDDGAGPDVNRRLTFDMNTEVISNQLDVKGMVHRQTQLETRDQLI